MTLCRSSEALAHNYTSARMLPIAAILQKHVSDGIEIVGRAGLAVHIEITLECFKLTSVWVRLNSGLLSCADSPRLVMQKLT